MTVLTLNNGGPPCSAAGVSAPSWLLEPALLCPGCASSGTWSMWPAFAPLASWPRPRTNEATVNRRPTKKHTRKKADMLSSGQPILAPRDKHHTDFWFAAPDRGHLE